MIELKEEYMDALDTLAQSIQESDTYLSYLEEEEEELYQQLQEEFEPMIAIIYNEVAENDPLMLETLEKVFLLPAFEGLYLPKLLGYAVLRGEINENLKYKRPQQHFKDILVAICESTNFEFIKKRIGQSVQIGFALSSDIWITDLINHISNKRIRYFLQSQKLEKYRELKERQKGYAIYSNQFRNDNYLSCTFPENYSELKTLFSEVKRFLLYRMQHQYDNSSLLVPIKSFITNKEFQNTHELVDVLGIYANFFDLDAAHQKELNDIFNANRVNKTDFDEYYFDFLIEMFANKIEIPVESDLKLSAMVDRKHRDQLGEYYDLLDTVHGKGYINPEVMDEVREFYNRHEGLSKVNECIRIVILNYLKRLITNLDAREYHEFFEISKVFSVYINIFSNEHFNQQLKEVCMKYVHDLMVKYVDKRGRDYQDIRKFVSTSFVDFHFLKEKEIVEMFKTRRKKTEEA